MHEVDGGPASLRPRKKEFRQWRVSKAISENWGNIFGLGGFILVVGVILTGLFISANWTDNEHKYKTRISNIYNTLLENGYCERVNDATGASLLRIIPREEFDRRNKAQP